VKSLRDLQRKADARREDLAAMERAVEDSVRFYKRRPSPGRHRDIATAVRELLESQAGRP
jgi:hypothetical protein